MTQGLNRRSFCAGLSSCFGAYNSNAVNLGILSAGIPARNGSITNDPTPKVQRWHTLPPTPELPRGGVSGSTLINNAQIFFIEYGNGYPVLLLHGGLANSNYWGNQIPELANFFRIIALDLRGHGRSTFPEAAFSYERLTADVIAFLDLKQIKTAHIIGWSDGAIIGLTMAMAGQERVSKLFAFGANYNLQGLIPGGAHSATFKEYTRRAAAEYAQLSPEPERYGRLISCLAAMWKSEPHYTRSQLEMIRSPVAVADGQYDEIVKVDHTRSLALLIRQSTLLIQPEVSHFGMLQDPEGFTRNVLSFLSS